VLLQLRDQRTAEAPDAIHGRFGAGSAGAAARLLKTPLWCGGIHRLADELGERSRRMRPAHRLLEEKWPATSWWYQVLLGTVALSVAMCVVEWPHARAGIIANLVVLGLAAMVRHQTG
jgi:hypothetical protein